MVIRADSMAVQLAMMYELLDHFPIYDDEFMATFFSKFNNKPKDKQFEHVKRDTWRVDKPVKSEFNQISKNGSRSPARQTSHTIIENKTLNRKFSVASVKLYSLYENGSYGIMSPASCCTQDMYF